ncbi:MAG TPA: glycosyltransferase [Acidimicrobiales bacterium]
MAPWAWPFAAVGSVVTAADVGGYLALRRAGVPAPVADAVALATAAALSHELHRDVTFAGDPYVRWVREPAAFWATAAVAGTVDLAVLHVADRRLGHPAAAKAVAVAGAAAVRAVAYRRVLFRAVRRHLDLPVDRPPPAGALRCSVVIPAYGEEARIGSTVRRVRAVLAPLAASGGAEVVVVDDGSPDGTAAAARAAGADHVIVLPANRGKGAAVRAGVLAARGRTVVFVDADLAYPPAQVVRLVEEVEAGWDVVVGSRRHVDTATLVRRRRLREVSGRLFNVLTRAVLLGRYLDTQCGIKAFRADVARLLFSRGRLDGFAFDVELFHLVERAGLSLREVPVEVAADDRSTVRLGRDARRMVVDLFKVRRWAGQGAYDGVAEAAARLPRGSRPAEASG